MRGDETIATAAGHNELPDTGLTSLTQTQAVGDGCEVLQNGRPTAPKKRSTSENRRRGSKRVVDAGYPMGPRAMRIGVM